MRRRQRAALRDAAARVQSCGEATKAELRREGCKDDAEEDRPEAEELRGTQALLVDEVAPQHHDDRAE